MKVSTKVLCFPSVFLPFRCSGMAPGARSPFACSTHRLGYRHRPISLQRASAKVRCKSTHTTSTNANRVIGQPSQTGSLQGKHGGIRRLPKSLIFSLCYPVIPRCVLTPVRFPVSVSAIATEVEKRDGLRHRRSVLSVQCFLSTVDIDGTAQLNRRTAQSRRLETYQVP